MSFKTEIEAIVGDIDSPDYTSEAGLYLTEGLKFILKYVSGNRRIAQKLTSNAVLNNTATTLDTSDIIKIVAVTRGDGTRNRDASEVPFEDFDDYKDANSIYYSSKFDPVYSIINDTLYVQPEPTASENAVVRKIQPAAISLGGSSVDNVPSELNRGIVLYASKEMLRKFLSVKNSGLPANLSLPSVPSAGSVGTVTLASLGTAPAYTKTALNLTSAPSISNLTISASVPSTIDLATVVYVDAAAGDASAGSVGEVTTGTVGDANVTTSNSAISALPAYTPAQIAGGSGLTGAPSINNLNINENAPSAPSIADVGVGSLGSAPAYTPPSLSLDFGTLSGSDTTAGTEASLGVDDFIYEEDVELAQISLQKMGVQIDKYQSDIQNQLNEFNENMTAYNANVQKIMKQADMEESESLQGIQKYAQEIDSYQTTVNKKVQEWQVNTEKELTLWQTKRQTELQQYSADIQNNLNEYQEHLNIYQVEVQEELAKQNVALEKVRLDAQLAAQRAQQNAAATTDVAKFNKQKDLQISMEARARDMEAIISNNNAKVADYQARVQSYGQQVSDQVQEYRANMEKELSLWNTKRNTELQEHQSNMQDELNEFQKELAIYQADLQHKIKQSDLSSEKEAMEIQQYATEVESYGQQVVKEVQNFTTKLQKITTDYQWYVDQYNKVSRDLVEFLSYYMVVPQIQEQANEATAND